jgi:N-acylneuraminate cytidylyltransferase
MLYGFVCTRKNSKGIPDKNIKNFCGKPLSYWVLKAIDDSRIGKCFYITDSQYYIDILKPMLSDKIEFKLVDEVPDVSKPENDIRYIIANDNINFFDSDIMLFAQVTNPFLTSKIVNASLDAFVNSNVDSMLSVTIPKRFFWKQESEDWIKECNYNKYNRPLRQDIVDSGFYLENGSFYIAYPNMFLTDNCRLPRKVGKYIMPSVSSIEIDDEDDWRQAEKEFLRYSIT